MAAMELKRVTPGVIRFKTTGAYRLIANWLLVFAVPTLAFVIYSEIVAPLRNDLLVAIYQLALLLIIARLFYRTFMEESIELDGGKQVIKRKKTFFLIPFMRQALPFDSVEQVMVGMRGHGLAQDARPDEASGIVALELANDRRLILNWDGAYAEMSHQGQEIARLLQKTIVDEFQEDRENT